MFKKVSSQKFQVKSRNCRLFLFLLSLTFPSVAKAQIIPDNTLPNPTVVNLNDSLTEITGGTTAGNNLFHSFEQFSIFSGETTWFNNLDTIDNIITRVTGDFISNIDGLIRANGAANLFLINPNGIVFGAGAQLDIGGSFFASSADSVVFEDGTSFSATNPEEPPLLTINIPLGLQYGSNPGNITVEGNGNNLRFFSGSPVIDRSDRPGGLQVNSGETLALVGGNVSLDGGNLTATEGRIEVGSVGNSGIVGITQGDLNTNSGLTLNYDQVTNFGDINLTNAASLEVSGDGAGHIQLVGNNIIIADGSVILANTQGDLDGGDITITAKEALEIISGSPSFPSGLVSQVKFLDTGNAGNIEVEAGELLITDGAQIANLSFGTGNSGNVTVKVSDLEVNGYNIFSSGIGTSVQIGGNGNAGSVSVDADKLFITNRGQIGSIALGLGNAGDVKITAEELLLTNDGLISSTSYQTGNAGDLVVKVNNTVTISQSVLSTGILPGATGDGGNLNLATEKLSLVDGGRILTTTAGSGNAGNLTVNAEQIELIGFSNQGRSGIFASAIADTGDGGTVNINTNQLTIQDGATISVSNFQSQNLQTPGTGKAGTLQITANSLTLDSNDVENPSTITASTVAGGGGEIDLQIQDSLIIRNGSDIHSATTGTGNGGNVNLTSNFISLSNGGQISANSTGTGQAGDISIFFNRLETNQGFITATSEQSGGGNINLTALASEIILRDNSLISTSVFDSTGVGGNITINTDLLLAIENSDIRANAVLGDGGNIQINAETLFLSPDSNIDASSQFGVDGVVSVNTTEIERNLGTVQLPQNTADTNQIVARSCPKKEDSLTVIGRGGLPPSPGSLNIDNLLSDLGTIGKVDMQVETQTGGGLDRERSRSGWQARSRSGWQARSPITNHPPGIVEAQGWIINEKGNIELVAYNPTLNSQINSHINHNCSG